MPKFTVDSRTVVTADTTKKKLGDVFETYSPKQAKVQDITALVHGESGVGKTAFLSGFPNPIFIFTEDSGQFMECRRTLVYAWKDFCKTIVTLERLKSTFKDEDPPPTLIIDTVDQLYTMCENHVCEVRGMEYPSDATSGAGWAYVGNEFAQWFRRARALFGGVWMTTHTTELYTIDAGFDERKGKKVPEMGKRAWRVIRPHLAVTIFLDAVRMQNKDGKLHNARVAKISVDPQHAAKKRHGLNLPDQVLCPDPNAGHNPAGPFLDAFKQALIKGETITPSTGGQSNG